MRSDAWLPLLLAVGLGGVVLWLYFRKQETAVVPCGVPVSAFGIGTVVPCGVVKDSLGSVATNIGYLSPVNLLPERLQRDVVGSGTYALKSGRDPLGVSAALATAPAHNATVATVQAAKSGDANLAVATGGQSAWETFKSYF